MIQRLLIGSGDVLFASKFVSQWKGAPLGGAWAYEITLMEAEDSVLHFKNDPEILIISIVTPYSVMVLLPTGQIGVAELRHNVEWDHIRGMKSDMFHAEKMRSHSVHSTSRDYSLGVGESHRRVT